MEGSLAAKYPLYMGPKFAFVEFESVEQAGVARKAMHGQIVGRFSIAVYFADPKRDNRRGDYRDRGPGQYQPQPPPQYQPLPQYQQRQHPTQQQRGPYQPPHSDRVQYNNTNGSRYPAHADGRRGGINGQYRGQQQQYAPYYPPGRRSDSGGYHSRQNQWAQQYVPSQHGGYVSNGYQGNGGSSRGGALRGRVSYRQNGMEQPYTEGCDRVGYDDRERSNGRWNSSANGYSRDGGSGEGFRGRGRGVGYRSSRSGYSPYGRDSAHPQNGHRAYSAPECHTDDRREDRRDDRRDSSQLNGHGAVDSRGDEANRSMPGSRYSPSRHNSGGGDYWPSDNEEAADRHSNRRRGSYSRSRSPPSRSRSVSPAARRSHSRLRSASTPRASEAADVYEVRHASGGERHGGSGQPEQSFLDHEESDKISLTPGVPRGSIDKD
ncbi:hypothetical protein GQ54DRAFT_197877 [Martensiomyces pterosporus]|nr:hypothetical protein GQ54DRAFT_197877 [Martensiomyces pterosporus]